MMLLPVLVPVKVRVRATASGKQREVLPAAVGGRLSVIEFALGLIAVIVVPVCIRLPVTCIPFTRSATSGSVSLPLVTWPAVMVTERFGGSAATTEPPLLKLTGPAPE